MSIYTQKSNHGLHWGWYRRKKTANDWKINISNYDIDDSVQLATPGEHLFKFGNEWGYRQFQHPRTIPKGVEWHFMDNPEIPQFIWPNPHNPKGSKDWVRFVPNSILTNRKTHSGTDRVNALLKEFSKGSVVEWQQIARPHAVKPGASKTVLLVPSSPNCYTHYYGTTQQQWIDATTLALAKQGYTADVRIKRGRKQRLAQGELTDQLNANNYVCTVSQHSASALESTLQGTPAVVTGPHPAGDLATPLEHFLQGTLHTPSVADVEQWCDGVLGNIRHKSELWNGEWR